MQTGDTVLSAVSARLLKIYLNLGEFNQFILCLSFHQVKMQHGHPKPHFRVKFSGVSAADDQNNMRNDESSSSHELCLIDAGIRSIRGLPLSGHIQTLNLHCNQITRLENLECLPHLCHLDLSSNHLTVLEGLDSLFMLRTLNVACNQLTTLTGIGNLRWIPC